MVDIIDEIKEDLQQERLNNLWKRYGVWIAVLAVLIVLATAGKVWWNNHIDSKQQILSKQYYDAMNLLHQGKVSDANALFSTLETSSDKVYPALAGFKRAEILLKENKVDDALAIYQTIASNKNIDKALRDLASLLAVSLNIEHHKSDSKTIEETLTKLSRSDGVWRFSAQELQAAYALGQGDKKKALEIYTSLNDNYLTPRGIKERASEMTQALGAEAKSEKSTSKAQ